MKHVVPNIFNAGDVIDNVRLNENIAYFCDRIDYLAEKRYVKSVIVLPINGLTNLSSLAERTIPLKAMPLSRFSLDAVELVIYSASVQPWTITRSGDPTWPGLTVTPVANTETNGITDIPMLISPTVQTDLVLDCPGASTISSGYVVLHLTVDRFQTAGGVAPGSVPAQDCQHLASSAVDGNFLNNIFTALTATIPFNGAAGGLSGDCLRPIVFVERNMAAGTVTRRIPSGAISRYGQQLFTLQAAGSSVSATVSTGTALTTNGAGATTWALNHKTEAQTYADDPLTLASDIIVTITNNGPAVANCVVLYVWLK